MSDSTKTTPEREDIDVSTAHEDEFDMTAPIENEETLENNIQALMTRASDPPRLESTSRKRIFDVLESHFDSISDDGDPDGGSVDRRDDGDASNDDGDASNDDGDANSDDATSDPATDAAAKVIALRPKTADKPKPRAIPFGYIALAAVALLGLGVFLLFGNKDKPQETPPESAVDELAESGGDTIEDIAGRHDNPDVGVEVFELPDGTVVKLDQHASVEVVGLRKLKVHSGRVALDVAKSDTPYVVVAPHGEVTVLGTRFLLDVTDQNTVTTVLRGTVRVSNDRGDATLHQGEEAAMSATEAPGRRPAPRTSHLASWARDLDALQPVDGPARRGNLLARRPDPRRQSQEFPLEMRNLDVDVHIDAQQARVTIDQTFFNQTTMQLEGVYSFPMPRNAAVSRLAMYVDGNLMEGGIIERDRGRNVYEGIVYQRRDPALLEWMQGNQFKVRIFPLPARTEKRILMSYTQALERLYDSYDVIVPIPEVDDTVARVGANVRLVGKADVQVTSSSHPIQSKVDGRDLLVTWTGKDVTIGDDLILTVHEPSDSNVAPAIAFEDDGEAFLQARVQPPLADMQTTYTKRRWVVLYDTSASRLPADLRAQRFVLERFLDHIDENDLVSLAAFDTRVRRMDGGFHEVGELSAETIGAFLDAEAAQGLGTTNLADALDDALAQLTEANGEESPHILYLGDGVAIENNEALGALNAKLADRATFVGVGLGDTTDMRTLDTLASATGGIAVALNPGQDLDWKVFDVIATLNTPRVLGLEAMLVDDAGQVVDADQYASVDMLAAGEEVTVVARLGQSKPTGVRLQGRLDDKPWSTVVPLATAEEVDGAFLPRAWARQRIEALLDDPETNATEISALGMKNFLVTPYTSLLVLENEKMYREFKVNRGSEDTWARYPAPETIEVVREPYTQPALELDRAAIIMRTPVQVLFSTQNQVLLGDEFGFATITDSPMSGPMGGLGKSGWGRGGGGIAGSADMDGRFPSALLPLEAGEQVFGEVSGLDSSIVVTGALSRNSRLDNNEWMAQGSGTLALQSAPAGAAVSLRDKSAKKKGRKMEDRRRASRSRFSNTPSTPSHYRYNGGYYADLYPQALHYNSDYRLNDLLEFVPGIFGTQFDVASEELLANLPSRAGEVSPEAAQLLKTARTALEGSHFALPSGEDNLQITSEGFRRVRTHNTGLVEEIVYNGEFLSHRYLELGLETRRKVGALSPAVLPLIAPFLLPAAADLAVWFDVSVDGQTLVLTPIDGTGKESTRYTLQNGRVVAIEWLWDGGSDGMELTWSNARLEMTSGDDKEVWDLVAEPLAAVEEGTWTTVEMPLRSLEYWQERENVLTTAGLTGSATWKDAMIQKAASASALQQPYMVATIGGLLLEHSDVLTRGDLVVLSMGASSMTSKTISGLSKKAVDASVVAKWLSASQRIYSGGGGKNFASLAKGEGLIGTMAGYRSALAQIENYNRNTGNAEDAIAWIEAGHPGDLSWILAYIIGNTWSWEKPKLAERAYAGLRDQHEGSRWSAVGEQMLVRMAYNRGDYDLATSRLNGLLDHASKTGEFPIPEYTWPSAFQYGASGPTGWRIFLGRWREAALKHENPQALLELVGLGSYLGDDIEAELAFAGLPESLRKNEAFMGAFAEALYAVGKSELAVRVVDALLDGSDGDTLANVPMLELAASIAAMQGRHGDAAVYVERVLDATADELMPLSTLRQRFEMLVDLRRREALLATPGATRDAAIERLLAAADGWRNEDPANPRLDSLVAEALFALDRDEEGWRHISSIIERGPKEGKAWADVAGFMEQQGDMERAASLWQSAVDVEPTNPQWLVSLARNAEVRGDSAQALEIVTRVTEGEWQDRFSNVLAQATRMQERLR